MLSTIGSRSEAQPTVARAVALDNAGHETVACAPPDFEQRYFAGRVEQLGISAAQGDSPTPTSLSSALRRALTESVATRTASVAARIRATAQYAAGLLHQLVNE